VLLELDVFLCDRTSGRFGSVCDAIVCRAFGAGRLGYPYHSANSLEELSSSALQLEALRLSSPLATPAVACAGR